MSLCCCLLKKSFDPNKEEQTTQKQTERNRVEERKDEVGKEIKVSRIMASRMAGSMHGCPFPRADLSA